MCVCVCVCVCVSAKQNVYEKKKNLNLIVHSEIGRQRQREEKERESRVQKKIIFSFLQLVSQTWYSSKMRHVWAAQCVNDCRVREKEQVSLLLDESVDLLAPPIVIDYLGFVFLVCSFTSASLSLRMTILITCYLQFCLKKSISFPWEEISVAIIGPEMTFSLCNPDLDKWLQSALSRFTVCHSHPFFSKVSVPLWARLCSLLASLLHNELLQLSTTWIFLGCKAQRIPRALIILSVGSWKNKETSCRQTFQDLSTAGPFSFSSWHLKFFGCCSAGQNKWQWPGKNTCSDIIFTFTPFSFNAQLLALNDREIRFWNL